MTSLIYSGIDVSRLWSEGSGKRRLSRIISNRINRANISCRNLPGYVLRGWTVSGGHVPLDIQLDKEEMKGLEKMQVAKVH